MNLCLGSGPTHRRLRPRCPNRDSGGHGPLPPLSQGGPLSPHGVRFSRSLTGGAIPPARRHSTNGKGFCPRTRRGLGGERRLPAQNEGEQHQQQPPRGPSGDPATGGKCRNCEAIHRGKKFRHPSPDTFTPVPGRPDVANSRISPVVPDPPVVPKVSNIRNMPASPDNRHNRQALPVPPGFLLTGERSPPKTYVSSQEEKWQSGPKIASCCGAPRPAHWSAMTSCDSIPPFR